MFEGSQTIHPCPPGNSNIEMNVWNTGVMIMGGESQVLEEKSSLVLLCPEKSYMNCSKI
jgi:hypothetical protein